MYYGDACIAKYAQANTSIGMTDLVNKNGNKVNGRYNLPSKHSENNLLAAGLVPSLFFGIFNSSYVMGDVGMTVTFDVHVKKCEEDRYADVFIDIYFWIPSPAHFVVIHGLEASVDTSEFVNDVVASIDEQYNQVVSQEEYEVNADCANPSLTNMPGDNVGSREIVLNTLQMSCSNYYHWMVQCLPRLIMSIDTIFSDTPLSPKDGRNNDTLNFVAYLPAKQYVSLQGNAIPFAETPNFVTETLDMLQLKNNSVFELASSGTEILCRFISSSHCNSESVGESRAVGILTFHVFNAKKASTKLSVALVPDWRFTMDNRHITRIFEKYNPTPIDTRRTLDMLDLKSRSSICLNESIAKCLSTTDIKEYKSIEACCTLLKMMSTRDGMEFALPHSLAHRIQRKITLKDDVGTVGHDDILKWIDIPIQDCLRKALSEKNRYLVFISRNEMRGHARSRHLRNEDETIKSVLQAAEKQYNNDSSRIHIIQLHPNGECTSHTFADTVSQPLLCSCLCDSRHGPALGRSQKAKVVFTLASAIIGVHGAGLTNMMWARRGTPVVEISLFTSRHRDYMHLAAALSHPYYIVMVNDSTRLTAFDESVDVNVESLINTLFLAIDEADPFPLQLTSTEAPFA